MSDTASLRVILAAVEAAAGPDALLNIDIWDALDPTSLRYQSGALLPEITGSLDAAVALAERSRPGSAVQHLRHALDGWDGRCDDPASLSGVIARRMIAVILRARIAEMEAGHGR